jgi:hypothetical protein
VVLEDISRHVKQIITAHPGVREAIWRSYTRFWHIQCLRDIAVHLYATQRIFRWDRTHFKMLKAGVERYFKLYFTKKSDTPCMTNGYGKAIREVTALRYFMDRIKHELKSLKRF